MTLSLFSGRKPRAHKAPNAEPARVGVNVTVTERDPVDDALPFNPDPHMSAEIRTHLWLRRNAQESK